MARTPCIPYRGSKQAIAPEIIKSIKALCPNAIYFYDLFGGGGAITVAALQSNYFKKVFYNEYDKGLVHLLTFLRDLKGQGLPKEYWEWVSREKFESLRDSDDDSAYATMVRRIWSFGNNGTAFNSAKEAEKKTGICHIQIRRCCKKRKYYNTAGGYEWQYGNIHETKGGDNE